MQQSDLSVAENFLYTTYQRVFINMFEAFKEVKDEAKPNIFFYQIPTTLLSPNILFDVKKSKEHKIPERVIRVESLTFINELQNLIMSYKPDENKPLVFSGILNYGKNYYIPYFIYVGLDQKIQIIILDPSNQPDKRQVREFLIYFFQNIVFKNRACVVTDPNVTQQITQYDCGFNALTVVEDAYRSSTTDKPMLQIKDGHFMLDTTRLSINGNNKPNQVVTQNSLENRALWAKRLYQETREWRVAKSNSDPITTETVLHWVFIARYSYSVNIANQKNNDLLNRLSTRVAALIGNTDNLRELFFQTLDLPNRTSYVRRRSLIFDTSLSDDILEAGETFDSLVLSVLEKKVEPFYIEAIHYHFNCYLSNIKTIPKNIKHQNQLIASMIKFFLQKTNVTCHFSKLSIAEKERMIKQMQFQARSVVEKFIDIAKLPASVAIVKTEKEQLLDKLAIRFNNCLTWIKLYINAASVFPDLPNLRIPLINQLEENTRTIFQKAHDVPYLDVSTYEDFNIELHNQFYRLFEIIMINFNKGDNCLNNFTPRLRLMLYHALDIQPKCSVSLLYAKGIAVLDEKIDEYFQKVLSDYLDKDFLNKPIGKASSRLPCRVIVDMKLPAIDLSCGITPELLTQFVVNWKANCKGRSEPRALTKLITAVNHMPVDEEIDDNTSLCLEWCEEFIKPIFTGFSTYLEIRNNKIDENFIFALQQCLQYYPAKQQTSQNAICISHIEEIYQKYQSGGKSASDMYVKMARRSFYDMPYDDKMIPGYMKHGLFEKPTEMNQVKYLISIIRKKYQGGGDFPLDSDDINLLNDLLPQKYYWNEGDTATDRAYEMLRLYVQEGKRNLFNQKFNTVAENKL